MIMKTNEYAAFLEGIATQEETRQIYKKMIRDSGFIAILNLAAAIRCKTKKCEAKIK